MSVVLSSGGASLEAILRIAEGGAPVVLDASARAAIEAGHACLRRHAERGEAIYGVSTGLGAAVDTRIAPGGSPAQHAIIAARAVGVGPFADRRTVRAVMAARLSRLCLGRSGISLGAAEALAALLDAGIQPRMPLVGSIGEADLAPLAHIALALGGAGEVELADGRDLPAAEALREANIAPPALGPKDGLALVSSNAGALGLAAVALADLERILDAHLGALALSMEAFRASLDPIHPSALALRPVPGLDEVARALLGLLADGDLTKAGAARRLQDPLSLRVAPHVLAAALDAFRRARKATEDELASSDDNPAVLAEDDRVLPTGSFDATHLALAFDTLALALARLAACAGERIVKLMSPTFSDLPRFLAPSAPGSNGFATLQKTVAALLAQIAHAATPLPFLVMPVADRAEDYASMAMPGIERATRIAGHLRALTAIELVVAARAVDLRGDIALGPGSAALREGVRGLVPPLDADRPAAPDIAAMDGLVASGRLPGPRLFGARP